MEKHQIILEQIRFKKWAKQEKYKISTSRNATDFSGMPAFLDRDAHNAWCGWLGSVASSHNKENQ